MKLGIRTKLISLSLMMLIIPLIGGALFFGALYSFNDDFKEYYFSGNLLEETFHMGSEAFHLINDYDAYNGVVADNLKTLEAEMIVIDMDGYVLYDSKNPQASAFRERRDIEELCAFDMSYGVEHPELHKHVSPVVVDNTMVANMIITKDMSKIGDGIVIKLYYYIPTVVITLFIIVVILTIRYISKAVLNPLKSLMVSAENIASGNLDVPVVPNSKDELGQFCLTFDRMRVELKHSLEQQLQYDNARKQMIASISHDLRTPLASVKGYVEGIMDHPNMAPEKMEQYLSVIKNKTDNLDRLIDDLFQFSQLELGRLETKFEGLTCTQVFDDIFKQFILEFEGGTKKLQVPRELPDVRLNVDKGRIQQVLENLIENAKRYTPEKGKIKIDVKVIENQLQVSISDNGFGIANEELNQIFEHFYRCEKSRSRAYGGVGLGLPICKYIIEVHGGKIWAESDGKTGSTFTFSLPINDVK